MNSKTSYAKTTRQKACLNFHNMTGPSKYCYNFLLLHPGLFSKLFRFSGNKKLRANSNRCQGPFSAKRKYIFLSPDSYPLSCDLMSYHPIGNIALSHTMKYWLEEEEQNNSTKILCLQFISLLRKWKVSIYGNFEFQWTSFLTPNEKWQICPLWISVAKISYEETNSCIPCEYHVVHSVFENKDLNLGCRVFSWRFPSNDFSGIILQRHYTQCFLFTDTSTIVDTTKLII